MSYNEFLSAETKPTESTLPKDLKDDTFNSIQKLLNPPIHLIFLKLLTLHGALTFITLSVCPQFGFRLFGSGKSLYDFFMLFGHHTCMILCGILFIGTSFLMAPLVLTTDEARKLEGQLALPALGLITISLASFSFLDTHMAPISIALWIAGALVGAWLCLKAGKKIVDLGLVTK